MKKIAFTFINEFGPEFDNLEDLTPVQIKQLHACVPLYYGEEEAVHIDTNRLENLFDEEEERWGFASLYHVIDTDSNEILYDFWEYNADSGTLFIHNSEEHIGIFMMQFHFGLAQKNDHNKLLPANFPELLQAAYKTSKR